MSAKSVIDRAVGSCVPSVLPLRLRLRPPRPAIRSPVPSATDVKVKGGETRTAAHCLPKQQSGCVVFGTRGGTRGFVALWGRLGFDLCMRAYIRKKNMHGTYVCGYRIMLPRSQEKLAPGKMACSVVKRYCPFGIVTS